MKGVSGIGIVGSVRASQPGGKPTIRRRNFLALLPALPPVCKAILAYNVEWEQFARELSRALRNLRKGDFLIIRTRDQYYVQFAGAGVGMRAEAVSNGYLEGKRKLPEKACSRLVQLGWNTPTIIPDPVSDRRGYQAYGSPNYFLDLDMPVPYRSLANLAVVTLRSIFGARHWGELRYIAFAKRGGDIEFPNLRIARAKDRA